jgi:hypothetical protein
MGTLKAIFESWQSDADADQFEKEYDEWRALFDAQFPDEEQPS